MTKEHEWRAYPKWNSAIEVSRTGEVRNTLTGRLLAVRKDPHGYAAVFTDVRGKSIALRVHRAVATCFVAGYAQGDVVNHINGDKMDARAENLEWCSSSGNRRHAIDVLGCKTVRGSRHGMAKISEAQAKQIREAVGVTQRELARKYGLDQSTVSMIRSSKVWTHV